MSLTCISCKIIETVLRDSIGDHLNSNNLLSAHTYGFTRGRSCETQLIAVLNDLTKSLDAGHNIDVIYLDF